MPEPPAMPPVASAMDPNVLPPAEPPAMMEAQATKQPEEEIVFKAAYAGGKAGIPRMALPPFDSNPPPPPDVNDGQSPNNADLKPFQKRTAFWNTDAPSDDEM